VTSESLTLDRERGKKREFGLAIKTEDVRSVFEAGGHEFVFFDW